jgi:hypothetical protein
MCSVRRRQSSQKACPLWRISNSVIRSAIVIGTSPSLSARSYIRFSGCGSFVADQFILVSEPPRRPP